jgi:uncharacterized protein (TIGR00251 family)
VTCWQSTKRGLALKLRVAPGASRNVVTGFYQDANGDMSLKVMTTAQPEKGKANKAVIAILAKHFKQSKSTFEVIAGETDRNKMVLVRGAQSVVKSWLLPALDEVKNG